MYQIYGLRTDPQKAFQVGGFLYAPLITINK